MTTLRALLYADLRSLVNQLREIRRSPLRTIFWGAFALLILGFLVVRVVRTAQHQRLPVSIFPPVYSTDLIVCATLMLFGFAIANRSRSAGLFAHAAEARLIIGSPATPFVATLYIQLREIVRSGARRGLGLLYFALFYLPDGLRAAQLVRDIVLLIVAVAAIFAAPLARQLLAHAWEAFAQVAGWLCIVAGAAPLLRDAVMAFAPPPPLALLPHYLPAWHPGRLLYAHAGVQSVAIAVCIACIAALALFVARAARDAYPELYELSMNRIARIDRLRKRAFGITTQGSGARMAAANVAATVPARAQTLPRGALIFVWRAWTEYRRASDTRRTIIETALVLVFGYAAARFAAGEDLVRLAPFAGIFSTLLFIFALSRSAALATELRRPMFWLSAATLFERLCGLALAHGWRSIAWFELGAIGLAAGHAQLATIVIIAVAGPCASLFAIAIGYASYGLLPHDVDQRGPLMFVRWMLGYALAIPAFAAGIAGGIFAGSALLGITIGSVTSLLEAGVLIGFAAWRLDRMAILLR